MNNSKRKEVIILFFCVLIGFALRFYTFDKKSLWMDEIYTYNDSRDNLKGQLKFYKENPAFLHPPLFFVLTHLFYPFEKPERDLRIIPLIFGTLSILMIYLLAKLFSPAIALSCTISLTLMAYHISLSQDGRSYAMLMFFGMSGLYCLIKHLQTSKRSYLFLVALCFAILFHTSYSTIPFIIFSQLFWFYKPAKESKKSLFFSFLILNGFLIVLCLPWLLFTALNYKGQIIMDPLHKEGTGPLWHIFYGIFHDWVPHTPLMIASAILLILFPFFSENKKTALILLAILTLPVGGLYLFCKLFNITHFISTRYFINFLPLFLITLFLSLNALEAKYQLFKRVVRAKLLFVILLIVSNLTILPLYYISQKQDFRGLASYLKSNLRPGDKIYDGNGAYILGILHYLGAHPLERQHVVSFSQKSEHEFEYNISFHYQGNIFTIYHSKYCCQQYINDGNRLWIIIPKAETKSILNNSPAVFKGYFDGSFLNFTKFPVDASMYLFLWDPNSPDEKGIDMPIE